MNNIKTIFSIKDLENLTGIKAHTIRIWEKRYELLTPERTDTNIRFYNLSHLKKLLNISFLNNNGHKISKIASLSTQEIHQQVRALASEGQLKNHAINTFKLAMLDFDQELFYETYNGLIKTNSFSEVFYDFFLPLLSEIGMLWQTDTITPAHEHFISSLIRQKVLVNTEILQAQNKIEHRNAFVLFLPDNEVHEIGLMFINYELIARGHRSILLGSSVPIISLTDVLPYYQKITFISYFTIKPEKEELSRYLAEFKAKLLTDNTNQLWALGHMTQHIDHQSLPPSIKIFRTINSLIATI
ncbi:MerR family transcriptional regulator [Gelidibacter salicanalis]|uniref:MerR family transcriptional regulator n=1 Tax=Gelidibacter salicanalis TaxID=291193 RepID=A0A934NCB2_9FLAO|nr:MerR family transcriptional regulator [Gelidibacter salicanalis]MBJ7880530.1 MerR family transcriptional regulator [Gelidibacter salicanalis]